MARNFVAEQQRRIAKRRQIVADLVDGWINGNRKAALDAFGKNARLLAVACYMQQREFIVGHACWRAMNEICDALYREVEMS